MDMWGQTGLSVAEIGGAGVVPVAAEISHRVSTDVETFEIQKTQGSRYLVVRAEVGTFRMRPGLQHRRTFTVASTTLNTLTCTAHGYRTGDGPLRLSNTGGGLPAGLAIDTDYWVVRVDANTIALTLTSSAANRIKLTAVIEVEEPEGKASDAILVDVTTNGTGTHEIGGNQGAGEQVGFDDPVAVPPATETGTGSWPLFAGETQLFTGRGVTIRSLAAGNVLSWYEV